MAAIAFDVEIPFDYDARSVWDLLVDWKAHEDFIPATRVDIEEAGIDGVGTVFTAYSGYGPLTLVDRMRVTELAWDEATRSGYCQVDKLGPVLDGYAGIRVESADSGSLVTWTEDLTVGKIPKLLAPLVAKATAIGFRVSLSVFFARELKKQTR